VLPLLPRIPTQAGIREVFPQLRAELGSDDHNSDCYQTYHEQMQACPNKCEGEISLLCHSQKYCTPGIDLIFNFVHTIRLLFQNFISKHLHEAEEEAKPAYASKSSDAVDGRPKYGSRKEFFQRVWDRLHGGDSQAAATSTQTEVIPMYYSANERVHPIPISHPIPFSSSDVSSSSYFDFHHDRVEDIETQNLFDDKYRRVTVCGNSLSSNGIKKRHSSAFASIPGVFPSIPPQSKKPKVCNTDM
jgi:hypothetical protein